MLRKRVRRPRDRRRQAVTRLSTVLIALALLPVDPRTAPFDTARAAGLPAPQPLIAASLNVLLDQVGPPDRDPDTGEPRSRRRHPVEELPAAAGPAPDPEEETPEGTADFVVDLRHGPVNRFNPLRDLGAGVDGVPEGKVAQVYSDANIQQMLSAGHGALSYRLYTELSIQDWHWNPNGKWSDSAGRGYFTGSLDSPPIVHSYGYRLPHRGSTHDQGNDDDYSRLTDGDINTYWKSNPYLAEPFTHEPDVIHPQWIVVDLGSVQAVDSIRIQWANPYARDYQVEFWTGREAFDDSAHGEWKEFASGRVRDGRGGDSVLRLTPEPVRARFVRLLMTRSSGTYDSHGKRDIRNRLGYAIAEIGLGTTEDSGFHDLVDHRKDDHQTVTYASSVDPWHEPGDRVRDEEQPGLDLVLQSRLTRNLPSVVPVAVAYGTPDDAQAEIRYLERWRYPIAGIEMGEEPDDQYLSPEDYGSLYLQWADAIHAVDPSLRLGGPVFAGDDEIHTWADGSGRTSWMGRFTAYLRSHGRLSDLDFYSCEHYPGDTRTMGWNDLFREPDRVKTLLAVPRRAGLRRSIPVLVTEYNFSADYTPIPMEPLGALWQADFVGSFLENGGKGAYFYEYEPLPLGEGGGGQWGSYSMYTCDDHCRVQAPTAQYFSSRILHQEWAEPIDGECSLYPVAGGLLDPRGRSHVTAYALRRPDGEYSILMVNKDRATAHTVRLRFQGKHDHYFRGGVRMVTFGVQDYAWHPDGIHGYADPDGPARVSTVPGGPTATYTLPRGSITVLRGGIRRIP